MNVTMWKKIIEEGRRLLQDLDRKQFEIGDNLLAAAPVHAGEHNTNSQRVTEIISRWMIETKCDESMVTLKMWRRVAYRWPPAKRVKRCSWSAHRELADNDNRFKLLKPGMNKNDAKLAAGRRAVANTGGNDVTIMQAIEYIKSAAGFCKSGANGLIGRELTEEHLEMIGKHLAELDTTRSLIAEVTGMTDEVIA